MLLTIFSAGCRRGGGHRRRSRERNVPVKPERSRIRAITSARSGFAAGQAVGRGSCYSQVAQETAAARGGPERSQSSRIREGYIAETARNRRELQQRPPGETKGSVIGSILFWNGWKVRFHYLIAMSYS